MLILRIRQAEVALADGRLDEAFELVRDEKVRAHRRGQKLVDRLAAALVKRGREHLEAERLPEALADCTKAEHLAGRLTTVSELKQAVSARLQARQRAERDQARAVADARGHITDGRLSIGERVLEEGADQDAQGLRGEVNQKRLLIDEACRRARAGLDRGDFAAALEAAVEARRLRSPNEQIDALIGTIMGEALQRMRTATDRGRIDLADTLLEPFARCGTATVDIQEMQRFIGLCRAAAGSLENGEARQAAGMLRQLKAMRPQAEWVDQALAGAVQAAEHLDALRGGPLGLIMTQSPGVSPLKPEFAVTEPIDESAHRPPEADSHRVPARFMLQIDGVGSFLVLRDRRVRIGPVSSSDRPDIGLLVDASVPTAVIERTESDYFLSSRHAVSVNDTPTTQALLADGHRVALSQRCRFRFHLPNAASGSAVLTFSGMRLPGSDARRAILFDREIIIGPGPSSHIRADHLGEPVVLHVRGDRLVCQADRPAVVDDQPADHGRGVPLDKPVTIGAMRFVVTSV